MAEPANVVADIDRMTNFSSLFEHHQTGRPPSGLRVFYAALIAEATNLGFSKMALACPDITQRQLQQMAIWRFREETFTLALARMVGASTPLRSRPCSDRIPFPRPTVSMFISALIGSSLEERTGTQEELFQERINAALRALDYDVFRELL